MDRDTDGAIETAAQRAREAQERMLEKPPGSPELVEDAQLVERRAEDLDVLARDSARDAGREGT